MRDRSPQPTDGSGEPAFAEALFTDLYELTMLQAYDAEGMDRRAVFELFFRELPECRRFAVAAGIDDVLSWLEGARFTDADLAYLSGLGLFSEGFVERLGGWRFTGEVHAMAEGTIVWPDEPVVQVVAPIGEAQLVETLVLNQVHFQSVAASKAARIVEAAGGRPVVDFGSRRSHGVDAAMKVARAAYLVGAAGTSNVLAGRRDGIPVYGTMAHSYIQAHDAEADAFERFAALNPGTTLLVDTYDTLAGVEKVVEFARRLGDRFDVRAVRLDSGDLAALAKSARRRLDEAGLHDVKVFASSGLDEYAIAALLEEGAPIDGFGVGTRLAVCEDAPTLDYAYKLVAYDGVPRLKRSEGKGIFPGRKQVFREVRGGRLVGDTIARHGERGEGEPLLRPVMREGRRVEGVDFSLEAGRRRFADQRRALPPDALDITPAGVAPPVRVSDALQRLADSMKP